MLVTDTIHLKENLPKILAELEQMGAELHAIHAMSDTTLVLCYWDGHHQPWVTWQWAPGPGLVSGHYHTLYVTALSNLAARIEFYSDLGR